MPSIRSLLDTFGQPPSEISLDWAWQIASAAKDFPALAEPPAADLLDQHDDWTALDVASDGKLRMTGLDRIMAERALEDLRTWVAFDEQLARFAKPFVNDASWTLYSPSHSTSSVTEIVQSADASVATDRVDEPYKRRRKPPRPAAKFGKWLRARRVRIIALSAGAVMAALLLLAGMFLNSASGPATRNGVESQTLNIRTEDSISESDRLKLAKDSTIEPLMNSQELLGLSPEAPHESGASAAVVPPLATLELVPQLTPSLTPAPAGSNAPAAEPNNPNVLPDARSRNDRTVTVVQDVMRQVASAVAQAESQAADNPDTNQSDSDAQSTATGNETSRNTPRDWLHQPPIRLSRDCLVLHHELPRAITDRPRDPHWFVRIDACEGFTSEPQQLQRIGPRTTAQCRIYDEEASGPRVWFGIHWINRGGRNSALDVQLVGGAEDFPALRLPLARKWLDPLRVQLRASVASSRVLTEAPSPPAPSELRTLLQNQKRLAREQLKLGERMLTIIAELDRLAVLLDGEIECHAQLRDGESGKTVLNYGSP